ncbi:1,4-alpha-glucan branching protein GlgB [bacterium]|nr:1,4-alpha-glucan branching protein GlgB [bacterium]
MRTENQNNRNYNSPILTDFDLYLFNEGNHHKIYDKLGSHKMIQNGVEGFYFAVWAPNAKSVSVIGDFNDWNRDINKMNSIGNSGVWELFIQNVKDYQCYKYDINTKNGKYIQKVDPYGMLFEKRPKNSSITYSFKAESVWNDWDYIQNRDKKNSKEMPISVYEVHLGSFKKENGYFLNYKDLAHQILNHVKYLNYTHIELMPIMEHPLDESWGYQVTGYFAPTSRFGTPDDFIYFINLFHENGIGVILDWVPAHFPKDNFSLAKFDGTSLYEHSDPRKGEHKEWGTLIPNFSRNEVKNFYISNALYWIDRFHIDGIRVDAVASMLYLDYSRKAGEWIPNIYGGNENLESIEFFKNLNSTIKREHPSVLIIAEDSTQYPKVTESVENGGLGFDFKWNMGWMNDSIQYMRKEFQYKKYHQKDITFSMMYNYTENFMLPLSHDEVVHGKGSLINKMAGDLWQKFAHLKTFYTYQISHPGKKLNFMGSEFAQYSEWNCLSSLQWELLNRDENRKYFDFVKNINQLYINSSVFWELDFSPNGFKWIDCNDSENSIISFIRENRDGEQFLCLFNFKPNVHYGYQIGFDFKGRIEEIFNSDSSIYFGSDFPNSKNGEIIEKRFNNKNYSLQIDIPPLAAVIYKIVK